MNKNARVQKKMKKSTKQNLIIGLVAVGLTLVLTLAVVLPIVLRKPKDVPFAIPALKLPIEEKYALQKYNYEGLNDTTVTLRSDIMHVTQRGLKRADTHLLDSKFSLTFNTDTKELKPVFGELVTNTDTLKTATINFTDYPSPSHGVSNAYTDGTQGGVAIDNSADFYKYMLMSQGQHLAGEAQKRSREGTLTQEWLGKHPSADSQYGVVEGTDNAVQKEITLDPIYRSLHATGLYLPAGEIVKVKVENLAPGERITIVVNRHNNLAWRGTVDNGVYNSLELGTVSAPTSIDAFFTKGDILACYGDFVTGSVTNQSQWKRQNNRAPWITADFVFDHNGEYNIGTPFGGIMHINPNNCYSSVKTTITGAVETPHYILGVTTPEYFDEYLRDAPGVVGVLDTENGQLIGPTGVAGTSYYMRQIKKEEVQPLAYLWHSFFSVNESFTGGTYNRHNLVMFDGHVPAGAAVALGNYTYACPTGWFNNATSLEHMLTRGQWGILHEVGHNHGSAYGTVWGFGTGREGEVRNNALTLLGYIMFTDVGTTVRNGGSAEHGGYADPYKTLTETLTFAKQNHTDFDDGTYGYFQCLGMYANIMHSFGADKFYELLYTYKENPAFVEKGTRDNIREDFNYRCSTVYGMNFTKYFNTFYKANLKTNVYSAEQLKYMNSLPNYEPVACKYAGGIDGVKTSGDYKVNFGEDVEFDLLTNTISSLDTEGKKGFSVISISDADHGTISDLGNGKCKYSFNSGYTGTTDKFSFKVKLSDGIIHEFTIYLRINYNSSKFTAYDSFKALSGGINQTNWENVFELVKTLNSKSINHNATSASFTTGAGLWQVATLEFYWKAPQTGEVTFHITGDDGVKLYFGNNFGDLKEIAGIDHNSSVWSDPDAAGTKYHVTKDSLYAIRLFTLNTGGGGGMSVGYKYENMAAIAGIPADQIYHPTSNVGEKIETYVFKPKFMISKKDNINLSVAGTDKSTWQIVEAPADELIHEGRMNKVKLARFDKDGNVVTSIPDEDKGNPNVVLENGTVYDIVEIDKWGYLIDGNTGTIMHTRYGTNSIKYPSETEPYKFVIDTGKIQQFNYFAVTTRTGNLSYSKITKYELQISNDGKNNWKTISKGDKLEYVRNVATLKFDTVSGRFLRLLVKDTTGNNGKFVVIAELDAGITATTQKIVASTSPFLYSTDGWVNTANVEEERSGYMMSTSKNQKLVFRFSGNGATIYSAVGKGFGSADVKLDGKFVQTINFNQNKSEARELVLSLENLEDKVHTLEIITKSSEKVMIYLFGIPYTAELVNAPNIYLERALTISLIVFIVLFVVLFALLMCLLFIPKFRKLMGNNKAINALDRHLEKQSEKRKTKRAAKKEAKKLAKENEEKSSLKQPTSETKKHESVSEKSQKLQIAQKQANVSKEKATTSKAAEKTKQTSKAMADKNLENDAKLASKKTAVKTSAKPVAKAEKEAQKPVAKKAQTTKPADLKSVTKAKPVNDKTVKTKPTNSKNSAAKPTTQKSNVKDTTAKPTSQKTSTTKTSQKKSK